MIIEIKHQWKREPIVIGPGMTLWVVEVDGLQELWHLRQLDTAILFTHLPQPPLRRNGKNIYTVFDG